ncbi:MULTISPECIES: murein hydrolase activator EnvC [unclassified Neisseria]|uniref:murein hydrolase activator EnvC family protein n=1 Tax=unclassified Neisseria TaxID=2623750 RepID=UPI001072D5BF|nr:MULTISPECIES: peptidoglycan DD-metalloendopeptidase family protein [unclassified Neisseria]MBF0803978.1 peptidoglycan DD-metalloendopeptidase family protein [Neisseria sp. 19428wB4_WF04]TFU43316.1 peptidase M23 [Neisseria sp. WF04]
MPIKPLLSALLLCCSAVFAAPEPVPADAAQAGSGLQEIRRAISDAQADLKRKQSAQQNARAALERTQAALTRAQQELAAINKQQRNAWAKLQKLQNELGRLKTEVAGIKAQVARLLAGQYKNRHPNAVALFLKNAEPGQKARYLQYSRYINEANQKVMNDLAHRQAGLEKQEAAIDAGLARLNKIKAQRQAAINKLGRADTAAQAESRRLSEQINSQIRHISALRENEQRLNALLADIAKRNAAKRRQEAEARKKAAQARLAAAEKARTEKEQAKIKGKPAPTQESKPAKTPTPKPQAPRSTLTAEDRALQAPDQTTKYKNSFSRMQGSLIRPVGGSISGRFGQARPGGGTWKGVFFATGNAPVRSIAGGTVAYAGALSGYGNMVVLDHGDGYVSVYSGLSSVSVGSGGSVGAGSTIGTSGSLPTGEQGLYLEIRYRRQPMNPLSWLR